MNKNLTKVSLSVEEIEQYNRNGFLLISNLISLGFLENIKINIKKVMSQMGRGIRENSYYKDSHLSELISDMTLHHMAGQLLDGKSSRYSSLLQLKKAKTGKFIFHRDNQYIKFDGPGLNFWFAITSTTSENGCLKVIPWSHVSIEKDVDDYEESEIISVPMNAGDCLVFNRLTLHGSGINETEYDRLGYSIEFHRNDVNAFNGKGWDLLVDKKPIEDKLNC
ncbi:MAG: hypothetical protein COA79_12635 [Planctomycetota bacterium]|nr:MAG: hypothetical protein COA79_12635 [Planctomycetota bacterium]